MNEAASPRALVRGSEPVAFAAEMIRPTTDKGVGTQSSFLRRSFKVATPGGAATLRSSALGRYRAFINGHRVGDDLLTPGWTSYWDRLPYQTYDVSALLQAGDNTIEIWLGDGWYRSRMMWPRSEILNTWGDKVGAIAELRGAGGELLLCTDTTWQSGLTPVMKSGIYFGESYDARAEGAPVSGSVAVVGSFSKSTLVPAGT